MTPQAYALSITSEDLATKTPTQLIEKAYADGIREAMGIVRKAKFRQPIASFGHRGFIYVEEKILKLLVETK